MASHMLDEATKDERVAQVGLVRGLFQRPEVGAFLGAAVIFVFFAAIRPDQFPTVHGIARFLDPASTLGIMAVAVAMLMIGGEFDLSTGVMTGTTGLIAGLLSTQAGWSLWPAMVVALVFALVVGFINGWLVVTTGLPSFIVTLATFFILRGANVGVTRIFTNQVRVAGIDKGMGFEIARTVFSTEITFLGVDFRTSIIWWIAITVLASWILLRTKYGSWIFAVGGELEAARRVGVPVWRVKISLFMATAAAAWLVGIMNDLRLRSAVASQGIGQEFVYIISAVIGGCLLTGGYGSAIGASIGAVIFGMARVGIVYAGWDTDWFYSFLGLMLLVAVLVNDYTRRKADEVRVAAAKARTEGE